MTRWGMLSDIHGNLPNLKRALEQCQQRGVTRYAILGDNLGRGDLDGCVDLIRQHADISIVGNRDLDWADRVGQATREYVLSLPPIARADDFVVSHGDARLDRELSTGAVRDGFRRACRRLKAEQARVWLFGHSHHARIWRLSGSDDPGLGPKPRLIFDAATDAIPATFSLAVDENDLRWAINVGSTGLPFPAKGPISFAVYDSEARSVEIILV